MDSITVTENDPQSWIAILWHVLDMAREDCISPDENGPNDEVWDEVCTAMAWISEELDLPVDSNRTTFEKIDLRVEGA